MNEKIYKLEDIKVWQEARVLRNLVYKTTTGYPADEKYNTVKHMRASSRNIPANIAEGFGRFHYQESTQFYRIARGSLAELRSDIYCSFDSKYISNDIFNAILDQVDKVGMLLNGFIKSAIKVRDRTSN